ncbi:MAG: hypothetical protein LBD35_07070 [Prevotellaceae bacterium]|nr:hypothetical protein [Prevotellaceae bacterium]
MRNIKCYLAGIAVALAIAATSGCQDVVEGNNWYTEHFVVNSTDWELLGEPNEAGSYFKFTFDKIPLDVSYSGGMVSVYNYITDRETGKEKQVQLPSEDYILEFGANAEYYYSVKYDYAIGQDGTIDFIIYVSDYITEGLPLPTMRYRVVIVW